jgi:hypothetical protein
LLWIQPNEPTPASNHMSYCGLLRIGNPVPPSGIICMDRFTGFRQMRRLTNFDCKVHRFSSWRRIVVLAAVCSLALNVATRYCAATTSHTSAAAQRVTSHSPDEKRQHLDKTATAPVEPVCRLLAVLQVSSFYPRFAPGGPPVHTLVLDESLYNRPPPSSEFLS